MKIVLKKNIIVAKIQMILTHAQSVMHRFIVN